jgi:hypothetical protein
MLIIVTEPIKICFSFINSFLSILRNIWVRVFIFEIVTIWKKIEALWKFSAFFVQNFFCVHNWNLWVKNKKIATFTFFLDSYIFSDRCLKNHKIFIFHFLSTFSEKLWKFSSNHVQNFLFVVFWTLHKKSCRITY